MPGVGKTLDEFKAHKLHSGSKEGPVVKSKAQALAIGLSEQRKEGKQVAKKHEPHHEATAPGHMGKVHDHHEEQTHAVKAPRHAERDGADILCHDGSDGVEQCKWIAINCVGDAVLEGDSGKLCRTWHRDLDWTRCMFTKEG